MLFSRTVTGPLLLLKDAWLNGSKTVTSKKKSVVEYVLDRRERLRSSINLTNIHAEWQKKMSKIWYDKKTRHCSFKHDDEVLALLPLPGKPLHAKYYGPIVYWRNLVRLILESRYLTEGKQNEYVM